MANSWLRLWHDMPNDPKWRTIARKSKQGIGDVIAVYLHVLVNASSTSETTDNAGVTQGNATERGRIKNLCADDIASSLDLDVEQVELILDAMQGKVLEGDFVTGWAKRQPKREDNSAARVKAFREKKRAEKAAAAGKQNANETTGNAGVTQRNAPDKDPDTDKDLKDKHLLPGAEKNQHQADAPNEPVFISLPLNDGSDFAVTASMLAEFEALYPAVDIRQELRNQVGWLMSEPRRRKTRRGIKKFITGWLSREQDRGPKAKPRTGENHVEFRPNQSDPRSYAEQYLEWEQRWQSSAGASVGVVGPDVQGLRDTLECEEWQSSIKPMGGAGQFDDQ